MSVLQRIRPTVALAVLVLGGVAMGALYVGQTEVASVAATGIVAMGRDIIASDSSVMVEDTPK